MLASVVISTVSLIALQVVLVVKVADWLSRDTGKVEAGNEVVAGSVNGRFAGIA